MTAREKNYQLLDRIANRTGVGLSAYDANMLRRAALTLHRWAELECGDGNDYYSWCISRDEQTAKPYKEVHSHRTGKVSRYAVSDREAGALKRVKALCAAHGLHFYHQGDPRGCALYVSNEPLSDTNYTNGVSIW